MMSPDFQRNYLDTQPDQKSEDKSMQKDGKPRKKKELFNYLATQGSKYEKQHVLEMEK